MLPHAPLDLSDTRDARGLSALLARALDARAPRTTVPFRVVFADGSEFRHGDAPPRFTVTFRGRRAELAAIAFGHVGLMEAYVAGRLDVDGDLALAFRAGMEGGVHAGRNPLVDVRNRWHERRFSNASIAQAKTNACFHYDLPQRFYARWLDCDALMYTCGYWKEGTATLEEAQRNKIDHVLAKVRLAAGESFVDVGCGFGGLLFRAWDTLGVAGTGINAATGQVRWLRDEIARRGLADRIVVHERDFREIPGRYDKLLSIGTLEHAGRDQLGAVVRAHANAMKPGALGVIHFIGHVGDPPTEFFIRKHVFPGGWIPSLARAIEAMEDAGLEVLDVENLRRHYALTLDAWADRFDRAWPKIRAGDPARFDERFRRTWRTYLWSCAELFRSRHGRTHLFQVLVSRGNADARVPMSRAWLYRDR